MDAVIRPGTHSMADPLSKIPGEPPPVPPGAPLDPQGPPPDGDFVGRYDANLQLILRRLADHDRTHKPRRWWQSR